MVNGFRYYRALESVSIASALSSALPFTHARSESINADSLNSNFLQLGRRSGGRPQRAVHPMRLPVNTDTHYFSRPRTRNLPIVGWLLVRRATSSATDSPEVVSGHVNHCVTFAAKYCISETVRDRGLVPIINQSTNQYFLEWLK